MKTRGKHFIFSEISWRLVDNFVIAVSSESVTHFKMFAIISVAFTLIDFRTLLVNEKAFGGVNALLKFFSCVLVLKIIFAFLDMDIKHRILVRKPQSTL